MGTRKFKRRQYIVDPDFQYRLIRKIAVLAGLIIVMSLSFLVLVHYLYGDIQLELIQPDPFESSDGISTFYEQKTLLGLLWPVLGICLIVTLVATFLFGIVISHRMAGPVFRMRGILAEMGEGDLRGEGRLRRKDDFKSLAEEINVLKKKWRSSIEELRNLCKQMDSEDPIQQKAHMKLIKELLSRFKTG